MNGRVYFVEMCHYGEIMTDILFENTCTYDMIFEHIYCQVERQITHRHSEISK